MVTEFGSGLWVRVLVQTEFVFGVCAAMWGWIVVGMWCGVVSGRQVVSVVGVLAEVVWVVVVDDAVAAVGELIADAHAFWIGSLALADVLQVCPRLPGKRADWPRWLKCVLAGKAWELRVKGPQRQEARQIWRSLLVLCYARKRK